MTFPRPADLEQVPHLGRPGSPLDAPQHRLRRHGRRGRRPAAVVAFGRLLVRRPPGVRRQRERPDDHAGTRYRKQFAINAFRNDYQSRRIRTLLTAGHLRTADAQARQSILQQRSQQADHDLARAARSTATSWRSSRNAERDRHRRRRRRPPHRGGDDPGAAPRLDDRRRARARRRRDRVQRRGRRRPPRRRPTRRSPTCKAGRTGTTVAKSRVHRPDQGPGRRPRLHRQGRRARPAVRGRPGRGQRQDTPTDGRSRARTASTGSGGSPRSSRRRSTRPTRNRSTDAGIDLADFRAALRRDVLRTKLSDAVLAGYLAAGPQREVSEIWHAGGPERARRGRDQASATSCTRPTATRQAASTVADDRPGVGQGRAGGQGHLREAQGRSRRSSTRSPARRATRTSAVTTGGKLPYFSTEDAIDPAFADGDLRARAS